MTSTKPLPRPSPSFKRALDRDRTLKSELQRDLERTAIRMHRPADALATIDASVA